MAVDGVNYIPGYEAAVVGIKYTRARRCYDDTGLAPQGQQGRQLRVERRRQDAEPRDDVFTRVG